MRYKEFISAVALNQTDKIKALNIPESSAPDAIPTPFKALIPDLLKIMGQHFDELADGMAMIGVFGLQPVGFSSHARPKKKNSRAKQRSIAGSFWCVLYFLPTNSLNMIHSWKNFKSVVIDCAKGIVMDQARYLHYVIHGKDIGKIYGRISPKKLAHVWKK